VRPARRQHLVSYRVGDVFAEQAARRGEPTVVGAEIGLRFQLTPRLV
jgi:hypothetical protein